MYHLLQLGQDMTELKVKLSLRAFIESALTLSKENWSMELTRLLL